jgi:hypothetical protein
MLELKDYQKEAVRKLKENIVDMLGWEGMRQKIVFRRTDPMIPYLHLSPFIYKASGA